MEIRERLIQDFVKKRKRNFSTKSKISIDLWLLSFNIITCNDYNVLEDEFRARVVEMEKQSILLREENSELRKNGKNSKADNP